jgi:translocation and assembly module TamB
MLAPPGPYQARVEMAIEARRILLQTLEIQSAHARIEGSGLWQDYPPFNQWGSGGPPPAGSVAFDGRLSSPDLGWLARGLKDIRRLTGRLEADLRIEGPLRDPRLQGRLRLADGELRPEADLPPVQALTLDAGLAGRDVAIHSLRGELGGAPFELSGSIADILALDGKPVADLRLTGLNLLLQRSPALRARADADLRLAGPMERLVLSGELAFTDGLFAKNIGLAEGLTAGSAKPKAGPGFALFSFDTAPLRDMRFDVRVGVRQPFRVKNNLVRGAVRPDLRLVGSGEAPELVGKVYLDPTRLYLPAGRMQFDSGVIHFEAVDPGRPKLDMVGTARMIGYDITAVVEGPYDQPLVLLTSVPPLPDADLLALVLTGQPPKTPGGEPVEKRQGLNVAVFIGRDVLMRMPGGEGAESLQNVLERFDVELGRSITRAGDETINARFRVADGVLRSGDTLYLTGEKDVFDHYNAGVRIVFRFR